MSRCIRAVFLILLLAAINTNQAVAKKYQAINEIPGQVPETDEERAIWAVGAAHKTKVRGTDELVNDAALEQYVEGIIARLMGDMVDQIGLDIDVLVFKDPTVNAWVYPDGTVAVQTGMLAAMENEAQLAAIMGHEVSHFLNRHAFIQIKAKQKQSIVGKGLGVLATVAVAAKTGAVDTGLLNSGQIWTDLVTSGYSRNLESKADQQGLELLIAAGYPADQALPGFEQMRQDEDDQVNVSKMWSSHPDIDARKKGLSKQIKKSKVAPGSLGLDKASYKRAVSLAVLSNSQLLLEGRKYDAAIDSLADLAAAVPDDARAHYFLAEALRRKEPEANYDARISAYKASLSLDENFAPAYRDLGLAYRQQGINDLARNAFEQYIERSPDAPDTPIIAWYRDKLVQPPQSNQESRDD